MIAFTVLKTGRPFSISIAVSSLSFSVRKKGRQTTEFKCAFMQHDPEKLPAIEARALKMSIEQVRKFSPETLSVMEFKGQRDIDITGKIYGDWPLLGDKIEDSWNVKFRRELDMTNASHLFKTEPTSWPLYEGKMVWHFDSFFEKPRYWLDYDEAVEVLGEGAINVKKYRVAFRDVAASTNERTLISSIIPMTFHGNTIPSISIIVNRNADKPRRHVILLIESILNSFCCDYIIRQKITNHMNFFYMNMLPLPRIKKNSDPNLLFRERAIISKAARLNCTNELFANLWQSVFSGNWTDPGFWYPTTPSLDAYGPKHEQDIRKRIRDQAPTLKKEWSAECGVHDRLPDRRDTGDRAQLRAEIDAYVAHLYGLSRDDFSYILDTFPVLKRKEEAAFGEFMSKRKCLEEYDRIGKVLAEQKTK